MTVQAIFITNRAGGLVYHYQSQSQQQQNPQQQQQSQQPSGLARLSSNEQLIFASTFHGIHAIAAGLSPTGKSSGINVIETDAFKLHCHQSMTGVKYIIITDPHHPERSATAATAATLSSSASAALGLGAFGALGGVAGSSGYSSASAGTGSGGNAAVDFLMRRIVELYADYAMKNPFHTPEMPLRSELFDNALSRLLETK